MCGIVAIASRHPGQALDDRSLVGMCNAIAHRGPDDFTTEVIDAWVALGFRRLSIIDLEGSRQPLRSEDGQVVLVFNGEIYNFIELRRRLVALGHVFATHGDGEVIVHGYEQWGADVFSHLEGMYSVALVDRRRRSMLIARDRFGIKPLFYRVDDHGLRAASEIKALLTGADSRASRTALSLGSVRMHVPWPFTAFEGIYRVPPASVLEYHEGKLRLIRTRSLPREAETHDRDPVATATSILRDTVARQMVADVPVGAFLSGGVDSTLIVALMRQVSNAPIHTFSVGTALQDESAVAAMTARTLGTTHHTISMHDLTFDDLMVLPRLYDEPFAETSALGVLALSRIAREHVKVALSGDGGDEIFGGYDSYRWIRTVHALHPPRRVAGTAHHLLMRRRWPSSIRRVLRAMILADDPATAQRDASTLLWSAEHGARSASERLSERIEAAYRDAATNDEPARHAMRADRLERLPNAMLTKVDIASMSASLEVRVPMLDDALVRYADRVPTHDLVGLRHGKLLLRRVLATLPGGEVAWAPKRGFVLPLETWLASAAVRPRLAELFGDNAALLVDLTGFDVQNDWQAFCAGRSRFSQGTAAMQLLWFASVAIWADRFHVRSAAHDDVDTVPFV